VSGAAIGTVRRARIAGPSRALLPDDGPVDVFVADGRIVDIAPADAIRPRGEVFEADGAWLLPGLWDHHVHALQWSLVAGRVDLSPAGSAAAAASLLAASAPRDGQRVGVNFRDALWPDAPDLSLLDAATGDTPAYLVNADLHSVWLNTAAFRAQGIDPSVDGVLREEAAFDISRRLGDVAPASADRLIDDMARAAAARGVVGIVDLEMAWNIEPWMRRAAAGFDTLHVRAGVYPQHLARAIDAGWASGDELGGSALVRVGSLKVVTDGSLGTRTAACSHPYPDANGDRGLLTVSPAELVSLLTRATAAGLECAVHAIGDVANAHALDAFAATGAAGTIEHAQLVAHADIPRFARLGVGASVQPAHALDDRDLTDSLWSAQTAMPYPLRALADAGANLLLGSDAPVSPLDPWSALSAAVFRTRDGREPWREDQALALDVALDASTEGGSQHPTRIEAGAAADLVLVADDPASLDAEGLAAMDVGATLLGGRLTFRA
jgi:predicted amidohydrolase YtcJ